MKNLGKQDETIKVNLAEPKEEKVEEPKDVQPEEKKDDKVIEEMILRLNGQTKVVLEAFDPEGGAYGIGRTHGHRH